MKPMVFDSIELTNLSISFQLTQLMFELIHTYHVRLYYTILYIQIYKIPMCVISVPALFYFILFVFLLNLSFQSIRLVLLVNPNDNSML